MIDFPKKVAPKNVQKGIRKCPQVNPARSKRGFGIDAQISTHMNALFYSWE